MKEHFIKENNFLKNPLYGIVDFETCNLFNINIFDFAKAFFNGGGVTLQYRDKISSIEEIENNFYNLLEIGKPYNSFLILNDYVKIANKNNWACHLGQEDIKNINFNVDTSLSFWGCSSHNLKEIDIIKKMAVLPNYIGYGAVFNSTTKTDVAVNNISLYNIVETWQCPIIFIGGITLENLHILPKSNHIGYAIIKDFFRYGASAANIEKYTQRILKEFNLS